LLSSGVEIWVRHSLPVQPDQHSCVENHAGRNRLAFGNELRPHRSGLSARIADRHNHRWLDCPARSSRPRTSGSRHHIAASAKHPHLS
jgi:hypothetical protein